MDLSEVQKFERTSIRWCLFRKHEQALPVPTVDPVGEILLRAADLIEREGWTRGMAHDHEGRCVFGAIYEITEKNYYKPMVRLERHLKMSTIAWNDQVCISKEQAVAALRAAARQR